MIQCTATLSKAIQSTSLPFVVSRFASIPSGLRAVAPFSERERAPLLGMLCLSRRSCAVGFFVCPDGRGFLFFFEIGTRCWAGLPDDFGGMGARAVYLLVSQIFGPYLRIFFSGISHASRSVPFSKKKDPRAGRGSYNSRERQS